MKKLNLILCAALFATSATTYAVGFAQTQKDGYWTDTSIWNWRNMTTEIPTDGYPNTSNYDVITHVAQTNNVIVNQDITIPQIFVGNVLSIVDGATFTVSGRTNNFLAYSGGNLNVINGKAYIASRQDWNTSSGTISLGGIYEGNFYTAKANSLELNGSGWSGFRQLTINFAFDETNFDSNKTASDAVIQLTGGGSLGYFAPNALNLDFSNVAVEELEEGTYYVSLLSYANYYTSNMSIESISQNLSTTLADGITFEGLELDSTCLYAKLNITSVPEPSTYAVIFGALALAFVAYRKKRA